MPVLAPTDHLGTVTWLGRMARAVEADLIIHGEAVAEMPLTLAGLEGEVHAGLTRPSCSRVRNLYPRYTAIANARQVSLVCAREMAEVAADLGLEAMDYRWVGASVVVEGIPDFSHLPPASRLQGEGGATLVVDLINAPCLQPAKTIERARPGHGRAFKAAAEGRRGVVAWVEREGTLRLGERLRLFVPSQRPWAGARAEIRAEAQAGVRVEA
jgi:hypothetical protein